MKKIYGDRSIKNKRKNELQKKSQIVMGGAYFVINRFQAKYGHRK